MGAKWAIDLKKACKNWKESELPHVDADISANIWVQNWVRDKQALVDPRQMQSTSSCADVLPQLISSLWHAAVIRWPVETRPSIQDAREPEW